MKKYFALLITAVILVSMCACNMTADKIISDVSKQEASTQAESVQAESVQAESTQAESTQEDGHQGHDHQQDTQYQDNNLENNNQVNKDIVKGTVSGNVYKSGYSGLTFTKPDGWRFYTDDELAQTMGVSLDELDIDAYSNTAAKLAAVYDMMVVDDTTGASVVIAYENLLITNGSNMTAEEYLAMVEGVIEASEQSEMLDKSSVNLCGSEYLKAVYEVKNQDVTMTMTYYLRSIDNYMNFALVTVPEVAGEIDVEAMFG